MRLGITGLMATGKSTLLGLLAAQGVPVFSADSVVRHLYTQDAAVGVALIDIAHHFGVPTQAEVPTSAELGVKVPHTPGLLEALEALFHPLVGAALEDFYAQHKGALITAAELPLLLEVGYKDTFDTIWWTTVPLPVQHARAAARGLNPTTVAYYLARRGQYLDAPPPGVRCIDMCASLDTLARLVMEFLRQLRRE